MSKPKLCECGCGEPAPIASMTSRARGYVAGQPMRFIYNHSKRRPLAMRFWEKVRKGKGCWLWQGSSGARGYGRIQINGRPASAHRASYELAHGPIPSDMHVCHRCDNPQCVRPSHLFLGTARDNVLDAERKGRRAYGDRHWTRRHPERVAGEGNAAAKLTEANVRRMRARYALGGITLRQIAAAFGIRKSMASNIIARRNWTHI